MAEEIFGEHVKDKLHSTFILCYCLGALIQLPGSVIPNAQIYFKYKFRTTDIPWDASSNDTNTLQNDFTADFSLVEKPTMILAIIVAAIFTRNLNDIKRLIAGFCGYISVFVIICLLVYINTDSWQHGFLYLMLFLVFGLSCCNGVFLIALIQLTTKFPPIYITAILSGQALCGIFSSTLEILTLLLDTSPETNGFIYFSITVLFIVLTLLYFISNMRYSPFFRYHYYKEKIEIEDEKIKIDKAAVKEVLKRQKYLFLSLIVITGCTVSVQPGVTATVQSVGSGNGNKWNDTFFVPVITFFCYNVFDLIGRELGIYIRMPKNNILIFCLSTLRIILIPLLLMCNLTSKQHTPVLINSDTLYIIFLITFAVSNGYMTNVTIVSMPLNYVNEKVEKPITTVLLGAFVILSLGLFAVVSMLLVKVI